MEADISVVCNDWETVAGVNVDVLGPLRTIPINANARQGQD